MPKKYKLKIITKEEMEKCETCGMYYNKCGEGCPEYDDGWLEEDEGIPLEHTSGIRQVNQEIKKRPLVGALTHGQ